MHRAVIFDLDGTLTRRYLDFDAIRRELSLPPGPILEALAAMPEAARVAGYDVLMRHEREAAERSELQDGAAETVAELRRRGLPVGILTRNARCWTELILARHGVVVDAVRTREDGAIKPSGEGVLALCARLDAAPSESWMIGDYLFDIQAGRAAGARTVLLVVDAPTPDYAGQADCVIRRLPELLPLIGNHSPR